MQGIINNHKLIQSHSTLMLWRMFQIVALIAAFCLLGVVLGGPLESACRVFAAVFGGLGLIFLLVHLSYAHADKRRQYGIDPY